MRTDYKLTSKDDLTAIIKNSGITTWHELIRFVKELPYGRNSNRTDLSLVIREKKGSCSSKHALLKKVANLNKINHVKLMLGMYRMSEKNTANIGDALTDCALDYIPEAHCYLKINNIRTDLTTVQSDFEKIESDLMTELEISPEQVSEFKVDYHKRFLKKWIVKNKIDHTFDEIWQIREKCISNLKGNQLSTSNNKHRFWCLNERNFISL